MSDLALEAHGVWKRFGDEVANHDVSFAAARGEIHAVVGENGAGKSTLMHVLYGLYPADAGEVLLFGKVRAGRSAAEQVAASIAGGLGMVHQHFMLVPSLTVVENVVLGRERLRGGLLSLAPVVNELAALGARYRLDVDPHALVQSLSVGEAQRVEILKVLWRGAEVIILDEPTQILTAPEVEALFGVLRELAANGKTVIVVTHKLDEVMALCQRVTVLRRGAVVATHRVADTTPQVLAAEMVGDGTVVEVVRTRGAPVAKLDEPRLRFDEVSVQRRSGDLAVDRVSLSVCAGEIVGVAGVQGNGQTELVLAAAGLLHLATGKIRLDARDLSRASPGKRRALGLHHIAEDRQRRGLILDFSVEENLLLGRTHHYRRWLGLDRSRLHIDCEEVIRHFDVRPPRPEVSARTLSGGNQQKILVGRELLDAPRALLCAQPTRGVDLGAAARIRAALAAAAAAGSAILLVSTELDELEALCDRVVVMRRGRIVGELVPAANFRQLVGAYMGGAELPGDHTRARS